MANNDADDLNLRQYQDDLDADPQKTDDVIDEETDDPSDSLLIPNRKLQDGPPESMSLDNMTADDVEHSSESQNYYENREDGREDMEDKDQGDWSNPDQRDNKS